jgi:mannobiose 2-epimerase
MTAAETIHSLPAYREEMAGELSAILEYWMKYMPDTANGGFFGSLDNNNQPDPFAVKGVVLNSRICWTFSAAYQLNKNPLYLEMASRAYHYLVDHFIDRRYGGVYWSVDSKGEIIDPRKQIYGLAFCLYGLAEYYKASRENIALHLANHLYEQIETHSYDKKNGGYFEAFTQGWKLMDDMRLSEKDDNEKKTMNTHLHIIEAYANLYSIWPDKKLLESIRRLLDVFDQYIVDSKDSHLHLFMDEEWNVQSSLISYGHDIEAAWLLLECAQIINDTSFINRFREHSIRLADAAAQGRDKDGGLWYEYDPDKNELIKEKHSWPQAEAMVGFFNAYQLTGEEKYLYYSAESWKFIKQYIRDRGKGEWFWGVRADYSVMQKEKAGFWKCPYHNARACMEIMKRISSLKREE